jgi:hypothetical protein
MKIRFAWFNSYLIVALSCFAAGCKTTETAKLDKQASTLRLHLEVNPDGTSYTVSVPIFRENPSLVSVYREPFINEGDVDEAAVVDVPGGGHQIKLQLNRHGTWILENVTTSYRGRRIVVESKFGQQRWLGAPIIQRRISNGIFSFTPDASREEAERIVRGLNNIAGALKKKS